MTPVTGLARMVEYLLFLVSSELHIYILYGQGLGGIQVFAHFDALQTCASMKNLSPLALQFLHPKLSECPKR
jgi:hypothetical protein